MSADLSELKVELRRAADKATARILAGFFKTGPGEYGEGDVFLGIKVPVLRSIARQHCGLSLADAAALLRSKIHEERLLALFLLIGRFEPGAAPEQRRIYSLYMRNARFVNNWDLVDLSAPNIAGAWLFDKSREPLYALARSDNLWKRRIAIVSTHYFIRRGQFQDALRIAAMLLEDREDLIHKATGWMLREVGKRDMASAKRFLEKHCRRMPRTMLRYALERFPEQLRREFMAR